MNETTIPTNKIGNCMPTKALPCLKNIKNFNKLAPNIVGIAKKNENSVETKREAPKSIAPRIVAPEREVPGIKAKTWKQPIKMANW